jgi:hypothetical protein
LLRVDETRAIPACLLEEEGKYPHPEDALDAYSAAIAWCAAQIVAGPDRAETGQAEGAEKPHKAMSPLQYDILDALRTLRATDEEKRVTGGEIANKVGGDATAQSVKEPLADLKRRRLVDSKTGRDGGSWLTSEGQNCINAWRPKQ